MIWIENGDLRFGFGLEMVIAIVAIIESTTVSHAGRPTGVAKKEKCKTAQLVNWQMTSRTFFILGDKCLNENTLVISVEI